MTNIISSGESSDGIILDSYSMFVYNGGIANNATINADRNLIVYSGGTVNKTTVNHLGQLHISSGGMAIDTTLNAGELYVSSGGNANNTIIEKFGYFRVYSGGIIKNTIVSNDGDLIVENGASAFNVDWTPCVGHLKIATGAYVTFVNQYSGVYYLGDKDHKLSSSILLDSQIISCNNVCVMSGGRLNNTTVGNSGQVFIYKDGIATNTIVDTKGHLYIYGGTAERTYNEGGYIHVYGNGVTTHTIIESGGRLALENGGIAFDTAINNGSIIVTSGGTAIDTTVFCNLYIESGGTAVDTIIKSGGYLRISSGGKLTGRMLFDDEAYIDASDGAFLDFDITRTSAGAVALINSLSCMNNAPIYTLTVDNTLASGTYHLADGVTIFNNMISVIKTSGEQLGSLMVGQKLETEYGDYTLKVVNGSLTVTVKASEIVPLSEDTTPPSDPTGLRAFVDGQDVALVWSVSTDDNSGIKEYIVKYSLAGEVFTARTGGTSYVLSNANYGSYSWSVQAVDFAGNESTATNGNTFTVSDFKPYTVEYSADSFEYVITFVITTPTLDAFCMPTGTYQMRVKQNGSNEWMTGDSFVAEENDNSPQLVKSDADGNADIFFANTVGTWESGYLAQHVGSINDWTGTNEYAFLYGKNKLSDIIEGSNDANILLMTDDDNGDALFVDDIYTTLPGSVLEQQSRIAQINEIRAGAGNDIVDMTSQRFVYVGGGLTIRGGAGNDVIWANKGDNKLFGDAGNDRIVGASGDDVIAGGIGNDRMHGGGGKDIFTFGENWGIDNVEQLATGKVTLWFASGSETNWNAETMTYTDGDNSVKVSGVTLDKITLKFGDDSSAQFAFMTSMGAFFGVTTERIFEKSGKGFLASL